MRSPDSLEEVGQVGMFYRSSYGEYNCSVSYPGSPIRESILHTRLKWQRTTNIVRTSSLPGILQLIRAKRGDRNGHVVHNGTIFISYLFYYVESLSHWATWFDSQRPLENKCRMLWHLHPPVDFDSRRLWMHQMKKTFVHICMSSYSPSIFTTSK